MRANERIDKRVAQYLRLDYCLIQTTVHQLENLTRLVENGSLSDLQLPADQETVVKCLILTVYEVNIGNRAKLKGLAARHKPFSAIRKQLVREIRGKSIPFQMVCPKNQYDYASTQMIRPINQRCHNRTPQDLFQLTVGLSDCQCDQYCVVFGDCCPDFQRIMGQNQVILRHPIIHWVPLVRE